jgi:transcription antitermination factor NusG
LKTQNAENKQIICYWFVARTRRNQELSVQKRIESFGIENFVPTRSEVRVYGKRKRMVQKVLIPNVVFMHTGKEQAYSLINDEGLNISFVIDKSTRKTLVVPEKQMHDFMRVCTAGTAETVQLSTETFAKGDTVQIVEGDFCGVEGELIRHKGKSHVLIHIHGVVALTVQIDKKFLKKLNA